MTQYMHLRRNRDLRQLIRYVLVGGATNLTIYLVYLLITYLGVVPKVAMTLVYMTGVIIGFMGNRRWTFQHLGGARRAAVRYGLAHMVGYGINFLILTMFVDRAGYSHQMVQAVAIVVVAFFLFISFKYFVFQENENVAKGDS